ncbi:helix-turn-helix domain-containing protein [Actinomadura gamaensis]|uniref:Helix-turn-helix domain-containing protein n=1 Tax=Actinomadura gamaensis TaxID=1763541 RepID=A0ABV9TT06_9ACTN
MATPMPDVPPEMRLYTVPDVMKMTGLSRSLIYRELRAGRLRSVRRGRSRRIPGTAVAEYIATLVQEAEAA